MKEPSRSRLNFPITEGTDSRIISRRLIMFSMLAILLLIIIGYITQEAMEESLIEITSQSLKTILDTDIAALTRWMDYTIEDIQEFATFSNINQYIVPLNAIAQETPFTRDDLLTADSNYALQNLMQNFTDDVNYYGYMVVNRAGLIISSDNSSLIGLSFLPTGISLISRVFDGENLIAKPFLNTDFISNYKYPISDFYIIFGIPVRDQQGQITAALIINYDPEVEFTEILSTAWPGETGETIVFDEKGYLISKSRYNRELYKIPFFSDADSSHGIKHIQLLDPGVNLLAGEKPVNPTSTLPLMMMVRSALSGDDGIDLQGHRDYRGVQVIGAWRWLEDYGFGIATKIDLQEANQVLRPLRIASWGIFILLTAGVIVILMYYNRVQHLEFRMGEVRQLGQYLLEEKIGEGGMGKVYKGRHAMMRRPTAIKILTPSYVDAETLARFEREVHLTSQLNHPNTVHIYDFGRTSDGIFYYVMEYLSGITLSRLIEKEGAIPPARVIYILRQICGSLNEAHQMGLIHRDIKPPNILLCQTGGLFDYVKVLDFGLAKEVIPSGDTIQTTALVVAGTPSYIAPERLLNPNKLDSRSDIFSLGGVGYNLLTGKDIFEGETAMDICHQVLTREPAPPSSLSQYDISEELDMVILKCLAKNPDERYQQVSDVMDDLDRLEIPPWTQKEAEQWWLSVQSGNGSHDSRDYENEKQSSFNATTIAVNFSSRKFQ
jgi:serine/threonine protein kinase